MINLKIGGANEAPDIIASGWPKKAITLLGKRDAHRVPCQGPHHLVLYFDDTELVGDKQHVAPTPYHLDRILAHTNDLKDGDNLFVHCKAGKSRSTAFSIAILIQHGASPQEAFDHVKSIRNMLIPNRLIIDMIDSHFALDGELIQIVSDYYQTLMLPGITLPHRGGWNL